MAATSGSACRGRRSRRPSSSTTRRPTWPRRCTSGTCARPSSATRAARLLEWLGHHVIRANHLGDWGTPFGMLIEHLSTRRGRRRELSIGDLTAFYRAARAKFDARRRRSGPGPGAGGRAAERRRADPAAVAAAGRGVAAVLPGRVRPARRDADRRRLRGRELLQRPARVRSSTSSTRRGCCGDSEGALCVFPAGFTGRDGEPLPLIVRKSDGGFGYAATDLAAIRYRVRGAAARPGCCTWSALPQRQHLEMVFAVAREAGWLAGRRHAPSTSGSARSWAPTARCCAAGPATSIPLVDLLDEAVARAAALTRQEPDLDERRARWPRRSASARSSTPTCPATGSRTTSSTGTGCSR